GFGVNPRPVRCRRYLGLVGFCLKGRKESGMAKARMGAGLGAGCLLLWCSVVPAWAANPSVAQMLGFRPKQEGVVCSTPTSQEQEACKVELARGDKPGSTGWLLRDAQG